MIAVSSAEAAPETSATMVRSNAPPPAPTPSIVLVTDHADGRVVPLLRAELEAEGLTVVIIDHKRHKLDPDDLREIARNRGAMAAIRVLVQAGTVDVWIADRITGKIVLREVLVAAPGSRLDEAEVVVRAVELLRASWMELDAPYPPRGEFDETLALARFVEFAKPEPRFGLRLQSGVAWTPGGVPVFGVLRMELESQLAGAVSLQAFGFIPFAGAPIRGPEGTAQHRLSGLGAGFGLRIPTAQTLWRPSVTAGLMALSFEIEGQPAQESLSGSRFTMWTWAPHLTGTLGYAVSRTFHFAASGLVGMALHDVDVVFDGRRTARMGRLLLSGTLGMELRWP